MKAMIVALISVFSLSAFAAEFSAKLDRVYCTIANNKLIRTQYMNKDQTLSFVETKTIQINGLDSMLPKVLETAVEAPADRSGDYVFTMKHEGKEYLLDVDASDETRFVIRMISQSCR